MWWVVIPHHEDDDVDLVCHCDVFVSLSRVSALPSFKERVSWVTPLSGCFQI